MHDTHGSESQTAVGGHDEGREAAADQAQATAVVEPKPPAASTGRVSALLTTSPESLASSIEALLLSVDKPISSPRLAEALGLIEDADDPAQAATAEGPATSDTPDPTDKPKKGGKAKKDKGPTPSSLIQAAVAHLNAQYEQTGRSFRINAVAGGYRVMTLPKFAPVLEQYHGKRERHGVSRAALETLAIIAYKQPITRAGLEAIRGVACGEVLRSLIERRLVTIVGRAEELGRPMLYGTTKAFLETFGLASVKDLPSAEDLRLGGADDADEE